MRILAAWLGFTTVAFGQWPVPRTAQDAYDFVQTKRDEARKQWMAKDPKGIALLGEMLRYLKQPLVADLAAGNSSLAVRRENILLDLAEAHAVDSRPEEALQALRDVARALPIPAIAQFIESRPPLRALGSNPEYRKVLEQFRRFEQFWESPAIGTAFRPQLTEAERIAGLSKFWSEVKYNFGYPEKLLALGWDRLYLEWIPKVQAANSTGDYYKQLLLLCAKLGDGHTNIYPPEGLDSMAKPPLRTELVSGKVMILDVLSPTLEGQGIRKGMEIVRVEGEPAVAYARREYQPYQSFATPGDLQMRVFSYAFLRGAKAQPVRFTLRDASGLEKEHTVARSGYQDVRSIPSFDFQKLPDDVALVTLNSFGSMQTARKFIEEFPRIRQSKAVILDLRHNGGGGSDVGYEVLRRFIGKPVKGSRQVMRRYNPTDRAIGMHMEFSELPAEEIRPVSGERFEGPVVVLSGAATYSAAEDFLVAWKNSGRGPIIGGTSGGSTGQPLFFSLPGGGSARVCTKKDTFPDGREWVGEGIAPDIAVALDVSDLMAGRDTVLERALRYLREKR